MGPLAPLLAAVLGAGPASSVATSHLGAGDAVPAEGEPHSYLGDFAVTYYWIAFEDERFAGRPRVEVLRDRWGREIARVSSEFRRELDREGTGRLRDGQVLNVWAKVAGEWRYVELAAGSTGIGAWGSALEPFVSVAADPLRVPPGETLYVPALASVTLPGGRPHPGYVRVEDRGSAIHGARLDVFIFDRDHLSRFERAAPSHSRVPVFVAAAPDPCRDGSAP